MDLPKIERKILKFWRRERIFEKSLERTKNGLRFVFYEGPPFANGKPGIHHLLTRAFKDIILRYKTMQGFYVERRAGWDTHGLPTELEAEKRLKVSSKKEIEKIGLGKFIQECRESVFLYKKEWEDFTQRMGYWLDLKNAYITCSNEYIESLWWILKQIWQKGLLVRGDKIVPYCPRCGTTLSSHEVAQGYKRIKEKAIFVKFQIPRTKFQKNSKLKTKNSKFYLLVWTTTPWTLPGNTAVAVNPKFVYALVKIDKEYLILAKERVKECLPEAEIIQEFKGKDLIGLEYEPFYPAGQKYNQKKEYDKIYQVVAGDFVSIDEGTGLVHIAPAFGEDDLKVGEENNLPILVTVDEEGRIKKGLIGQGKFVKEADCLIINDLKRRGLLYKEEFYEHDYPFCWRCSTPLLYYIKTAWFIKTTAIKKDLLKNNQKVNWIPRHLKKGRFGSWLEELKDWNLSRERYWGTPLPIWVCQKCQKEICIGSIEELNNLKNQKSKLKIKDIHRPYIDEVILKCECGGEMRRVPEVVDCWFDSGAMPLAQWHYPFENREKIEQKLAFPADYICEGIDQTRGWFYTLLAVSTLLGLGPAYKNVLVAGIVLDEKGQKMSKSKGNVVLPEEVLEKYGADVARFYFYTINQPAETKRFDFRELQALSRRFFDTFWHTYLFFELYKANIRYPISDSQLTKSTRLLDQWIISRTQNLAKQINEFLDKYEIVQAARLLEEFVVEDLSNWYVRRSRRRFQRPKSQGEKKEASKTLFWVLLNLTKLSAPFIPFLSEEIYLRLKELIWSSSKKGLSAKKVRLPASVHLNDYPQPNLSLIKSNLEEKMRKVREIVSLALAERQKAGIKIRQPLSELRIKEGYPVRGLLDLIKEEVNVKKVILDSKLRKPVQLNTQITPKLREEGILRELIRAIQQMRKDAGLKPDQKIYLRFQAKDLPLVKILLRYKKQIKEETKTSKIEEGQPRKERFLITKEIKIGGQEIWLGAKLL